MADIPHLALPLRIEPGGYAVVEQDTVEELTTTVSAIVSFPLGYRLELPEFGIEDPEFEQRPLDLTDIEAAVETYEPRAEIDILEESIDPSDPTAAYVTIAVSQPGGEE